MTRIIKDSQVLTSIATMIVDSRHDGLVLKIPRGSVALRCCILTIFDGTRTKEGGSDLFVFENENKIEKTFRFVFEFPSGNVIV